LWDAVIVPDGAGAAETLQANGQVLEFLKDQYRHCKTLLALGTGAGLLEAAEITAELPDGGEDPGVLLLDSQPAGDVALSFAKALSLHRHFARQTDPPAV